ncbi:hypothetical protein Tco_0962688, partial [Tanacetum coccineum]
MSTIPHPAADEASQREEVDDFFFLAWSRPIGRTSRTSSSEPAASSFKFKPHTGFVSRKMQASQLVSKQDALSKFANTAPMKSHDHSQQLLSTQACVFIIEQLVKVREKNVFWSINEGVQESLLNLTSIRRIILDTYAASQDLDEFKTIAGLRNIHRIYISRYVVYETLVNFQNKREDPNREDPNTSYPDASIRRIGRRLRIILKY